MDKLRSLCTSKRAFALIELYQESNGSTTTNRDDEVNATAESLRNSLSTEKR